MHFYYLLINLTLIISCFILGILLFVFLIPKNDFPDNFKFPSRLLAVSYILLACLNISVLFGGLTDYRPEYFSISAIVMSSIQSLIFAYVIFALFDPLHGNKGRKLFIQHSYIILFFLLAFVILTIFTLNPILGSISDVQLNIKNPLVALRIAFFAFYLYQILHYIFLFNKALRKYNATVEDYFSETGKIKTNWVKIAFFSALIIGLMAIVFQTYPSLLFDNFFTSVVVAFYIVFAISFINHSSIFHIIEPVLLDILQPEAGFEQALKKSSWSIYKQKIVEDKIFLNESITLIEMAALLNVSRTTLSNFINAEENRNFNSWVNQLRISEAKRLMMSDPTYAISDIALKTGYSAQSNFSREFKQITGETPTAWKKSNVSIS